MPVAPIYARLLRPLLTLGLLLGASPAAARAGPSAGPQAIHNTAVGHSTPLNDAHLSPSAPLSFAPADPAAVALSAGWHLLSYAVQPPSTKLTDVLASLGSSYDIVLGFDAAAGGAQSYFTSPSMQAFNTLTNLLPLHGYWVHLTATGTLTIVGTPLPAGTTLSLTPGWNLVGYGGTSAEPLAMALGHLSNTVDIALGFDASQGGALSYFTAANMARFNNLSTLQPNAGYWLHLTVGGSLAWSGS